VTTSNQLKLLGVIALVLLTAGPAYPQEKQILQLNSDVLRLQQTVNQLQTSVDQKTQVLQKLVEKMADQMSSLTSNVQKISQTLENVTGSSDRTGAELRGLVSTLNNRVSEMNDNLAAVKGQLTGVSQQITTMKSTAEPLPGPDEIWRSAYVDYTAGLYDLAVQEFSEFQSKFPTDPRAGDAQLYKGNALYALKKYEPAIVEYDMFLQKYPENDHTKTALLKKGLAQADNNDVKGATATLQQVVKQFPRTVEAANADQKLKELATGARGRRGP